MSTRLINSLAWVIPALPWMMFWFTWEHYSTRRWAEYLIVPVMLLCVLVGLGTIAALWVFRRSGYIRLRDPQVLAGLVLAVLDVIFPVGLTLAMLALLVYLGKDFRIMP